MNILKELVRRRKRPEGRMIKLQAQLPEDMTIVAVAIRHVPTGHVQIVNVEDPVLAAEHYTREAS